MAQGSGLKELERVPCAASRRDGKIGRTQGLTQVGLAAAIVRAAIVARMAALAIRGSL